MTQKAYIKGNAVTCGDVRVVLTPQEATIIYALIFSSPNVDVISEILWPNPNFMPDFWANTIRVCVCTLRKKLEPFGIGIRAGYGRGYQLVMPEDGQ